MWFKTVILYFSNLTSPVAERSEAVVEFVILPFDLLAIYPQFYLDCVPTLY